MSQRTGLTALPEALGASARPLVVTGSSRFIARLEPWLRERDVTVFARARAHVPRAVVQAARAAFDAHRADAIVAVGGGAAIGLGKALRLECEARFVAVPTTFAGSERTSIWGIAEGGDKRTGRDPRVRPDAVIYDAELVATLPRGRAAQSLLNALAHPVGALEAGLADDLAPQAFAAIAAVGAALRDVLGAPTSGAWSDAFAAAAACADVLERAPALGLQHRLAHRLGGRFLLDHAALHAVLLPHTLAELCARLPRLADELARALDSPDPPAFAFDVLARVGAPRGLGDLGLDRDAARAALSDAPFADEAFIGRRPSLAIARVDWGLPARLCLDGDPAQAALTVLALHAPGASAESAAAEVRAAVGHVREIAVVAPQTSPGREIDEALAVVARLAREAPALALFGCGHGAVLARELCGRAEASFRAVLALDAPVSELERARMRRELRAAAGLTAAPPRGWGGHHQLEVLPGAVPRTQNVPRRAPYGLVPEQLNGTGFVAARHQNQRTWVYRVRPSAQHGPFAEAAPASQLAAPVVNLAAWAPAPIPEAPTDFVDGLTLLGGAGSPEIRRGYAIYQYACSASMNERAFTDADGDLVILPERGELLLLTELGELEVGPGRLAVVPRGLRFSVLSLEGPARGYVGEIFAGHFALPERGPVGANALCDVRHFVGPRPFYEDRLAPGYQLVVKHGGRHYHAVQDHSPWDVVGWHGSYAPYSYDLALFCPVANVRFDHADPSIFTVLTAALDEPGAHALDLVVFPPRWDATEGTFRPPFFHRNVTTEINGIVRGGGAPFEPGMVFVTPAMTAHGVRARVVADAIAADDASADAPTRTTEAALWFQFETALPFCPAADPSLRARQRHDWPGVWGSHPSRFRPWDRPTS